MLHFYCHYRRCRGVEGSKGKLVSIFKWVEGNHSAGGGKKSRQWQQWQ